MYPFLKKKKKKVICTGQSYNQPVIGLETRRIRIFFLQWGSWEGNEGLLFSIAFHLESV